MNNKFTTMAGLALVSLILTACEADNGGPLIIGNSGSWRSTTTLKEIRFLGVSSVRDFCNGATGKIELNGSIFYDGSNPISKNFSTTPGKFEMNETCSSFSVSIQEEVVMNSNAGTPTTAQILAGSVDGDCNITIRPGVKNFTITVPNGPKPYKDHAAPVVVVCP